MKSRRDIELESTCFVKSSTGLWIKSYLKSDGIEVFWQVRTAVIGDNLVVYDANGVAMSSTPRHRAEYPPSMRSAGTIPIGAEFLEFAGEEHFEELVGAVMRHVTNMVAAGYGDTPEEVVEWFSPINELKFLDGSSYVFVKELPPYEGLMGIKCLAKIDENGSFKVDAMVSGNVFDLSIESRKDLILFIICTKPV